MGFNNFHNKPNSPAKVYNRWRGGEGKLTHWDGQADDGQGGQGAEVEEKLPFKFAILEQTRRISGFAPGKGSSTRFYSNEAVEYDDVIKVMAKDGDAPAREVATGKYADIKDKLPQGARLAVQLYVYNPERKQIEVVTCQGASLGAFIEFSKKNKIYENYVSMKKGAEAKNGAVTFFPPQFNLEDAYDQDTMKELVAQDKIVTDYLKTLHSSNEESVSIDEIPSQEPKTYADEESQEIVEEETTKAEDGEGVDFGEIPF